MKDPNPLLFQIDPSVVERVRIILTEEIEQHMAVLLAQVEKAKHDKEEGDEDA